MARRGLLGTGTIIKVNNVEVNYAQSFEGLGGTADDLDGTTLKDKRKIHVPGLPDSGIPTLTYLFDNHDEDSDFRVLKALEDANSTVPLEVKLPDGTTFSTTAQVKTSIDGTIENSKLLIAKAEFTVNEDWTITNPST